MTDDEYSRRAKRSPWEIEIATCEEDGTQLEISAALWPCLECLKDICEHTPYPTMEIVTARRWVAGIVARLVLIVTNRMRQTYDGSPLASFPNPRIWTDTITLVDPGGCWDGGGPLATVDIPPADADRWLEVARTKLAELLAADAKSASEIAAERAEWHANEAPASTHTDTAPEAPATRKARA